MIAENLLKIKENVADVCQRCQRNIDEITIVAVTKIFPVETIQETIRIGMKEFGENFVQELCAKKEQIPDENIHWHFIGHLQKNKVKYIAPWITLVHSVDSISLAEELNKRAAQTMRKINVLLEIHTTNEPSKYGIRHEHTLKMAQQLQEFQHISLQGLMTMGPLSDNP